MLLYWGMFTVGFLFGSVLAFVTFAPKKPEDDPEYTGMEMKGFKGFSEAVESKNNLSELIFSKESAESPKPESAFSKKVPEGRKIFLTN